MKKLCVALARSLDRYVVADVQSCCAIDALGKDATVLTLEYKIDATAAQSAAMDEAIRTVQFIRNKCVRAWMDAPKDQPVVKQPHQQQKQWHTQPTKGQTLRRHQRPKRSVKPVVNRNIPPEPGKQSHNYQKARKQLAQAHLHVQRQREDFARKTASALIS